MARAALSAPLKKRRKGVLVYTIKYAVDVDTSLEIREDILDDMRSHGAAEIIDVDVIKDKTFDEVADSLRQEAEDAEE